MYQNYAERAFAFFVLYATFERTLREKNEFRQEPRNRRPVEVSLEKFWTAEADNFIENQNDEIIDAVNYLVTADTSPKVFVLNDGATEWIIREYNDANQKNPFKHIKQVRSNLFHGGKNVDSPTNRDVELVEKSISILLHVFNICNYLELPQIYSEIIRRSEAK